MTNYLDTFKNLIYLFIFSVSPALVEDNNCVNETRGLG